MKRILQLTMTMVLLLAATGINAENYNGTMERFGDKLHYTFSGGTVTGKGKGGIIEEYDDISSFNKKKIKVYQVKINGEVTKGSSLNISWKRLAGLTLPNEAAGKVILEYDYVYDGYSVFNDHKKIEHAKETTASIPFNQDNIIEVRVKLTYSSPHNKMVCYSVWKMKKEGRPTTPNRPDGGTTVNSGRTFKDQVTCEKHTMKYSISGGTILKKEKPNIIHDQMGHDNHHQSIKGIVQPGATIEVDMAKVKGEGTPRLSIVFDYHKKGQAPSFYMIPHKTEQTTTIAKTYRVPNDAEYVEVYIHYQVPHKGADSDIDINATLYVGDRMPDYEYSTSSGTTITPSTTTTGNFNWNDVSNDKCDICMGKFTGFFITANKGGGLLCCGSDVAEGSEMPRVSEAYEPIFVKDKIVTFDHQVVKVQRGGDESSSMTIGANSNVRFEGFVNGNARWYVSKGTIVGQRVRTVEKVKPMFDLSYCIVELVGTSYVIQKDNNSSSVYLLDGSIKVTSKKKNTSYTLKPGQVSSVNKEGKITVKKFDVNAMARKYDINLSGTTTTGNTGLVFTADKINYKILSDKTVEVTSEVKGIYSGHVKIPAKVKHSGKEYQVVGIGPKAFADQTKMTSVEIPTSIRGIAEDAFLNTGLTQVVIPGDEVSIVKNAFRNCKKLTIATCSGKKPQCSPDAFNGCSNMKELRIKGISPSNNGKKLNGTNAVIKVIK